MAVGVTFLERYSFLRNSRSRTVELNLLILAGLGFFASMTVCLIVFVLYTAGVQSDSDSSAVNNKMSGQSNVKPNRPSLAKILLSLDGNLAKQQALSHVLSALQIMYARYVVYTSSPGGSEDYDAHHVTARQPDQVRLRTLIAQYFMLCYDLSP